MHPRTLSLTIVLATSLGLAACADPTQPGDDATTPPDLSSSSAGIYDQASAAACGLIGQQDPAIDVPAVQEAVDAGGTVVLCGTFSFEGVNLPGTDGDAGMRVILVSGPVILRGEDATILGGGVTADGGLQAAFLVDAPAADVTLEDLHFLGPNNAAIRVVRSGDLRIEGCEVDGVVPTLIEVRDEDGNITSSSTAALGIDLRDGPFGAVTLQDNRLRIGGSEEDGTGGIGLGGPADRVEIVGNRITEVTAHGMNLLDAVGPALIDRNVVVTGPVTRSGEPGEFVDALRILGSGEYRVIQNEFDCAGSNCAVVRLAATSNAEIRGNEITASMPAGAYPGPESAGVQIRGTATDNEVRENRIRGRGRVAISVLHSDFRPDHPDDTDGNPARNTLIGNAYPQFGSNVATIEIGEGARGTEITGGSGTLIDEGTGTVVQGNYPPP